MFSVWIVTSSSVDALSMDCNQFKYGCSQYGLKPVQVWMLSVWIETGSGVDALSMDCNQFRCGCSQYGL